MRNKEKKPIVFIVEDNDAYRILVSRMLEQRGFLTLMFEDGYGAIKMLEYITPDIILSDIQMPGLDGFRMNEKIKEFYPELNIPIQYISSTKSKDLIKQANLMGVNKLIQKPAQANELSDILLSGIKNFAAA